MPEGVTSAYGVEGASRADAQTYPSPATIAERHGNFWGRHAKSRSFWAAANEVAAAQVQREVNRRL